MCGSFGLDRLRFWEALVLGGHACHPTSAPVMANHSCQFDLIRERERNKEREKVSDFKMTRPLG